MIPKYPGLFCLHNQDPLQHPAVDQRHAEERVVLLFARLLEILVARMLARILHRNRPHLLSNQPHQALAERHAQGADATWMQTESRRKHQVRSIRLEQVRRTHIGPEARCHQRHHLHECVGGFAPVLGEVCDLIQCQNKIGVSCFRRLTHRYTFAFHSASSKSRHF